MWLGLCARHGAIFLAIAGSLALVVRVGSGVESARVLWIFAPIAIIPVLSWRGVRDAVPSEEGAAAWLDLRSGAQGYLLAEFEQYDARWNRTFEA
ncbi:MAG: hypothetical protein ACI8X5_003307 [Planctomycetota bacterium]|jgi:hypothetical protein